MNEDTGYPGLLLWAGGVSLAAGMVHFIVSPEYLGEWWGYGFFFLLAGLAQLTYGLLLFVRPWAYDDEGALRRRPEASARPVYLGGAAGNLAIICLYLITRTTGIPFFGPGAGRVEPLTVLSAAVTLMEAVLAGALLALARRGETSIAQPVALADRQPREGR